MCGENDGLLGPNFIADGSSPRVRGKRIELTTLTGTPGLIPACAGKTVCSVSRGFNNRAHPRVCGKNHPVVEIISCRVGSSPRVRGKLVAAHRIRGIGGLIPACAGKTSTCRRTCRGPRAHPRVCGENSVACWRSLAASGSSPRVRGKRGERDPIEQYGGLIPACAGKTRLAGTT